MLYPDLILDSYNLSCSSTFLLIVESLSHSAAKGSLKPQWYASRGKSRRYCIVWFSLLYTTNSKL